MAHITKKGTGKTAEASSETLKALKPKHKISKSAQNDGVVDINKLKGALQLQEEKNKKKKNNLESKNASSNAEKEDARTLKVRGMKQKNAVNGERSEKRKDTIRIREKHALLQKKQHNEKNKEKFSRSKKNEESQFRKERHGHIENRKEKLGGLIFMCNERTKPDCFRYRVMGVQMGKKEMVLGVKPGLKLFLYDLDLRVMYGIYKASSSGGIKLESAAFEGDYPVQVRFSVDQDCYPLPESVFKRAIKENYTGIHRFNLELSVKKLTELFRPAELPSHAPSIIHPPPVMVTIQDREVKGGARESWAPLHMESLARDPPTYGEGRRYHLPSNEYDHQHLTYKEVPPTGRDVVSLDYYPSEKEYRAYGLLRTERQNFSPYKSGPALDPYSRGYVREQPPPTLTIQDREINEGARESRAQLHSERLAVDPRSYVETRGYPVLSNVSDQHLTYKEVPPIERENFSHGTYPSEKEYRTYGLRREIQNVSPPRSRITPTLEPYSRDHVREHLVMHPSYDPHVVTEKAFETYSLIPGREPQSSTPLETPTLASTLDSYSKDPYYAYSKGGSAMDLYQLPLRREEGPLGSYSLSGRGETHRSVTDHLQARDSYLTQSDQSRMGESYVTESNHLGRMEVKAVRMLHPTYASSALSYYDREVKDVRMLHPTYASSALSYYDRVQKYPEARAETSHAPLSSLYSLAGPSLSNR
ncbi:hypothetical protein C3L33_19973, partial [Rhododendron williamsianum]